MKKTQKLLTALICIYLMTFILTVGAFADYSGTCTVGKPVSQTAVLTTDTEITAFQASTGVLPTGMSISNDTNHVYVSGTPSATGSYQSSYFVTTGAGIQTFNLTINVVAAAATPAPTATATASPTATTKPAASAPPKITKHPSGETVQVGGTAKFISRAENATKHVWRIVSADTTETVPADQASAYFAGLQVSGTDTDTLVLSNIPKSMDKWAVECKFTGAGGDSFSNGAVINVREAATAVTPTTTNKPAATASPNNVTVKSATITQQPAAVTAETGKSSTLTVEASSPDGGSVSYQWYSSPVKNLASLSPISGATSAAYTPPQTEGIVYYCAGVVNTKDGKQSSTVYSDLVAVSYPTAPSTPTPSIAPFPSPSIAPEAADNGGGMLTTVLFFLGLGLLTIVAITAILIYIRRAGKKNGDK